MMLVDAQIILMILVSFFAAVVSPAWARTALLLMVFAFANWAMDGILDLKDYSNPWMLALFNFLCGMVLLAWGSHSNKTVQALTFYISVMFFVAMIVEGLHMYDINNGTGENETNIVYPNYKLMMVILNLMQYLYLIWGIPYGRISGSNPNDSHAGSHISMEAR